MSSKQSTTSTVRRSHKPVDPPRKFSTALKRRRKTFSVVTLATFVAILFFLRAPFKILTASKTNYADDVVTTRVSIPLDEDAAQAVVEKADAGDAGNAGDAGDAGDVIRGEPGKCLKHVLYDKPVKTGSTAIMMAVREYLKADGRSDKACGADGPFSCVERAKSICNGTYDVQDYFSIIGHFEYGTQDLVKCLRPYYYIATSVRNPYQRRKSAYLWNRTLNGTHFAIPYTVSFAEFMNRLPRCQLLHYYDGRGLHCDVGVPLEQRIQDIVDRVDEVIDIYDDPVGPLHKLISKFLARENESIKVEEDEYVEDFDRDTLKEEQMLYDRLREKRLREPDVNRLPC